MGQFDEAWAEGVADPVWPEHLVTAAGRDPGVLGTRRAIAPLRRWRDEARTADPETASNARTWLRSVAHALAGSDEASRTGPSAEDPSQHGTQVIRDASIIEAREVEDGADVLDLAAARSQRSSGPALVPEPDPASSVRTDVPGEPPKKAPRSSPAATQVRGLVSAFRPLVQELMPLPQARRVRRFWARWREVAGDRGVRRDFIEAVLNRAQSAEELLADLIAEVQGMSLTSVKRQLEALSRRPSAPPPLPEPTAELPLSPLLGASVKVEVRHAKPGTSG